MLKVGILGGTGYAGQELIRLLHNHNEVEINKIISTKYKNKKYNYAYRNFVGIKEDVCEELDWTTIGDDIDVLFSALPYGVLMESLNKEILQKVKIIDIGVDYRFAEKDIYKRNYGKDHKSIELGREFVYGLSEWNYDNIKKANYIANPGCYATAIQLALLPLLKEDLIELDIIIDGKCGVSGGGRTLTLGTHYAEANESMKAYKLNNHPHMDEVIKGIKYFTDKDVKLTFTPHLIPMQRGMMITAYIGLKKQENYQSISDVYNKYYKDSDFVKILDQGIYVETKWVKNSNICHINFEINKDTNKLIVVAAIDNLIKGASGQAIQNMNIMHGFVQKLGLGYVPICI